ncbi:IS200/IS605 family transposase [Sporolactobacillus shoreae]|uniref:IS200/IS605 family transposase n=1 Tax=Sporolactobacillus shoreae TaxID=1465501 RepID=A0A4Z0GNV2_9BACL|nr:IS200/IS605 family transposase [Sporolactobacillus shoreae]TGA98863.1 IS200/IS605 family transposase [Sporolactobacillus shoreae]
MKPKKSKIAGAIYTQTYVYNFHFHLIWITKYRRQVFTTPPLVQAMKAILQRIADLNEIRIETMEVMPDHVHLLISFKPKLSATDAVKALKGGSARLFFDAYPEIKAAKLWGGHLWTRSYYMSTLGNMSKETVEQYIEDQYSKEALNKKRRSGLTSTD